MLVGGGKHSSLPSGQEVLGQSGITKGIAGRYGLSGGGCGRGQARLGLLGSSGKWP